MSDVHPGLEVDVTLGPTGRPGWRDLPLGGLGFRVAHAAWGIVELGALSHVWASALLRRRDRYVWVSVMLLLLQGAGLVAGRGNCPFGPVQRQLGDPVPMFELVLPPRAAKAAIPALAIVAVAGMAALLLRPPSRPTAPDQRPVPSLGESWAMAWCERTDR